MQRHPVSPGPAAAAMRGVATVLICAALAGCAAPPPADKRQLAPVAALPAVDEREVARLAALIRSLGPGVDPEEAARAAQVSLSYPLQLRRAYGVTDPPLIHNTKVNLGLRPRGLCYQWADDMEARLRHEDFRTLTLHRAIANTDSLRIDHSTVILSRRGDGPYDGIVLDPWRHGGRLYWGPVLADPKYRWVAREELLAAGNR